MSRYLCPLRIPLPISFHLAWRVAWQVWVFSPWHRCSPTSAACRLREAAKKIIFLMAVPPPLVLNGSQNFCQKVIKNVPPFFFFLNGKPYTEQLALFLMALPLRKYIYILKCILWLLIFIQTCSHYYRKLGAKNKIESHNVKSRSTLILQCHYGTLATGA